MEVTIKGAEYKIRKLTPFQQFHVARRLAPALWALGAAAAEVVKTAENVQKADTVDAEVVKTAENVQNTASVDKVPEDDPTNRMLTAFGPVAKAFASMSDADSEYILGTCLSVVLRKSGSGWAEVAPKGSQGYLAFDDITLPTMIELALEVIKENLGNFFDVLPGA